MRKKKRPNSTAPRPRKVDRLASALVVMDPYDQIMARKLRKNEVGGRTGVNIAGFDSLDARKSIFVAFN
jgi:hypothetical protein